MVSRADVDVALVGATGTVGTVLLQLLQQRNFPVGRLVPLASRRSVGAQVSFRGESLPVAELEANVFDAVDLVFFAATGALSRRWAPVAHNVVPLCEDLGADGSSSEERKLRLETRKILGERDLPLTATCTRVPVPVGHAASAWLETRRPLPAEDARRALADFPGVRVLADDALPTPQSVAGSDDVQVGRVRADPEGPGLWLWQVADNLRKGTATNAVQIAEALRQRGCL